MNGIVYRKAGEADIPQLIKFRKILLKIDDTDMDGIFDEFFRSALQGDDFIAWVACDGSRTIASACFSICRLMPRQGNPTGKMAYLANVYTLPEYRGRGIATRLINEGESELKGRGIGRILLHSSDMAKPLYEKLGFEAGSNYMVRKL